MKLKISVIGAMGRMGQEITTLLKEHKNEWTALAAIDRSLKSGKAPAPFLKASCEPGDCDGDLLIEFTGAAGFSKLIRELSLKPRALVSGSTGLDAADQMALKNYSKKAPVLWAPNMSLGVACLKKSLENFLPLKHFDFVIEEIHHNKKKDAPSGTAKALQSRLESLGLRTKTKPVSIRGGGIFGIHRVWAMGDDEYLCFEHVATNRTVFARGALLIGQWLAKQPPGFYSVEDFLSAGSAENLKSRSGKRRGKKE